MKLGLRIHYKITDHLRIKFLIQCFRSDLSCLLGKTRPRRTSSFKSDSSDFQTKTTCMHSKDSTLLSQQCSLQIQYKTTSSNKYHSLKWAEQNLVNKNYEAKKSQRGQYCHKHEIKCLKEEKKVKKSINVGCCLSHCETYLVLCVFTQYLWT